MSEGTVERKQPQQEVGEADSDSYEEYKSDDEALQRERDASIKAETREAILENKEQIQDGMENSTGFTVRPTSDKDDTVKKETGDKKKEKKEKKKEKHSKHASIDGVALDEHAKKKEERRREKKEAKKEKKSKEHKHREKTSEKKTTETDEKKDLIEIKKINDFVQEEELQEAENTGDKTHEKEMNAMEVLHVTAKEVDRTPQETIEASFRHRLATEEPKAFEVAAHKSLSDENASVGSAEIAPTEVASAEVPSSELFEQKISASAGLADRIVSEVLASESATEKTSESVPEEFEVKQTTQEPEFHPAAPPEVASSQQSELFNPDVTEVIAAAPAHGTDSSVTLQDTGTLIDISETRELGKESQIGLLPVAINEVPSNVSATIDVEHLADQPTAVTGAPDLEASVKVVAESLDDASILEKLLDHPKSTAPRGIGQILEHARHVAEESAPYSSKMLVARSLVARQEKLRDTLMDMRHQFVDIDSEIRALKVASYKSRQRSFYKH